MARYKITVIIETDEDDSSRVLDAVQDDLDQRGLGFESYELCSEAVDNGEAVTVESC